MLVRIYRISRAAFSNLEAARDWVSTFAAWYNHEHLHSGIKFVSPAPVKMKQYSLNERMYTYLQNQEIHNVGQETLETGM